MFSVQKFFSHDAKFFELLEASADETRELTRLLIELLKDRSHAHPLHEFAHARGKDKRITDQISEELVNTFVTGLEREDIETLSYAMYRICKSIEKFAERFNLAPQRLAVVDFTRQVELMARATETLAQMVRLLRKMPPLETVKELNDRLQNIEGEADDVMIDLLREVYGGKFEPLQSMMVRDLYDLLEKVIDRCRDAGNAISHIVLKNSKARAKNMTLIFVVILIALVFEYINGFHDTANSIATVVATKVLTPRQAVVMAACTNLIGAMLGAAVASTIASGLVDPKVASQEVLICALMGAVIWNLITWRAGLPSSSSHALVGGLIGAAVAAAGNWSVVIWSEPDSVHWYPSKGVLWKVIIPMFASPLIGFVLGFLIMGLLYFLLRNWKPRAVNAVFGRAQMFSAAGMGLMHGTNDAQKTMGIIALALASGTADGRLADLPNWLSFLRIAAPEPGQSLSIALWIKVMCALVMAAGTAAGGWRIIKTLGHKMVKLQPVNGFAAETTSAVIIGIASYFGIPVSTTHNISAAIMGVGAAKRFSALRWTVVERMAWAWLLTMPVSGTIAYFLMRLLQDFGYAK